MPARASSGVVVGNGAGTSAGGRFAMRSYDACCEENRQYREHDCGQHPYAWGLAAGVWEVFWAWGWWLWGCLYYAYVGYCYCGWELADVAAGC